MDRYRFDPNTAHTLTESVKKTCSFCLILIKKNNVTFARLTIQYQS